MEFHGKDRLWASSWAGKRIPTVTVGPLNFTPDSNHQDESGVKVIGKNGGRSEDSEADDAKLVSLS